VLSLLAMESPTPFKRESQISPIRRGRSQTEPWLDCHESLRKHIVCLFIGDIGIDKAILAETPVGRAYNRMIRGELEGIIQPYDLVKIAT
jgi:hypothetical protein